ncbi:MAG: hypothetical protein HQM14_13580 [SAR324 cluster bacterium]|nr:hypothetical protein [SAR324 cluster bacterium]
MQTGNLHLDQAPPEDIPFRFFLSGPFFGILAGGLIFFGNTSLFLTTWHMETVALTHLITLGWLALIMMGAFYQMVPVLVGGHVPYLPLARFVHGGMVLGIVFFTGGLISSNERNLLTIGGILLVISVLLFLIQLTIALFRVKASRPTVLAMRISIISLAIVTLLGGLLLGQLAGWWALPFNRESIKGIHLTFGLLGWVGCLIVGVGFHVIPMFYLATSFPVKQAWWVLYLLLATLIFLPASMAIRLGAHWSIMALLPAIAGSGLFIMTLVGLFQKRKRKVVDTTLRYWQLGLSSLLLSFLVCLIYPWLPHQNLLFFFGLLFLLGFGVSITNGMLYKIVPFLIWLHRFSSLVGKVRVPFMSDITPAAKTKRQLQLSVVSYVVLAMGIASHQDWILQLGGILLMVSSGMLFLNLYFSIQIKAPEI